MMKGRSRRTRGRRRSGRPRRRGKRGRRGIGRTRGRRSTRTRRKGRKRSTERKRRRMTLIIMIKVMRRRTDKRLKQSVSITPKRNNKSNK